MLGAAFCPSACVAAREVWGAACAQGAGGDPGSRVLRVSLAWLPVLSVCPAAPAAVSVGVCGHGSSVGSPSVAIVPCGDSSRVVVGMQWIRKKCPFHKF